MQKSQQKRENNWAVDVCDIETELLKYVENNFVPIAVIGTTGTTSSCAFDNLKDIGALSRKYNLWFHIDAAYGGAYAALPEMKQKFKGIELSDSFALMRIKNCFVHLTYQHCI